VCFGSGFHDGGVLMCFSFRDSTGNIDGDGNI
jgi:hypothetical protein